MIRLDFKLVLRACALLLGLCVHSISAAYVYPVHLDRQARGNAVDLILFNDGPVHINVIVELTQATNAGFSPAIIGSKYPHLLAPGSSRRITTAVPLKQGKPAQFSYRLKHAFGDPSATPKLDHVYRLPIPDGSRGVVRPYTGAYTNNYLVETANAIEILLPIGTPVVASRAGIVINAKGRSGEADGETPSSVGNMVSILHDDGTWGTYGWLANDSVIVKPGDRVEVGQRIAASGSNPDAYETYLMLVVNKNYFSLQLKSVPIKLATSGGEVFDVLSFSGPVSPNLPPKYKLPPKDEEPWVPSEKLVPPPPPPIDWHDEHLTPTQRAALFRQRMADAAEAGGSDTISGSKPLIGMAILAAVLGGIGAFAVVASHSSTKPAGFRGTLWSLFRGNTSFGQSNSVSSDNSGNFTRPESAPLAGFTTNQSSDSEAEPPPVGNLELSGPAVTGTLDSEGDEHRAKPLFAPDRLKFLALIAEALPVGILCTPSVAIGDLIQGDPLDALDRAQVDFVLVDTDSGEPQAAILFAPQEADPLMAMQIARRLSLAGIPTVSFETLPKLNELKAKLKRLI